MFWTKLGAIGCFFLASATSAAAHPHVFADTEIGFRFDETGAVTSLQIKWSYDEFTTLTLYDILGLDPDGDGELDGSDFAKIADGETNWPPGYKGDLHLSRLSPSSELTEPKNALAGIDEDRVWVAFDLPLSRPVQPKAKDIEIRVFDPVYYYAYTIMEPVALIGAPDGCNVAVSRFDENRANAELRQQLATLSREETPSDPNIGSLFAETVTLTCS